MNHTYSITPSREKGQHLTLSDRFSIQVYDRLCFSLRMIANELNCSPSTILNELRRGTESRNENRGRFPQYSAKRGQAVYEANRSRCHQPHKCQDNSPFIEWVVNNDKWLDACEDIPAWAAALTQKWRESNATLAAFDIDSDSYVLFVCTTDTLAHLSTLAEEIGNRIDDATNI